MNNATYNNGLIGLSPKQISELLKHTPAELTDMGICPTCLDRLTGGGVYGDSRELKFYEDEDLECFFASRPRARGHAIISVKAHYHDMSEAPDEINEKTVRYAKRLMGIITEVFGCERVYLCTMCDGPMNHYHVQLIPRYSYEKRGSENFVKPRGQYIYCADIFNRVKALLCEYAYNRKG